MTSEVTRFNLASGSPLEPLRGFSRAVQVGDSVWISGTTAMTSQGDVVCPGDPYEQTKHILSVVKTILGARAFRMEDVVRTRLYVTNIARWEDYARAHREVFHAIRPASSLVQVMKLVDPRLVIEMEVDAVRGAVSTEYLSIVGN